MGKQGMKDSGKQIREARWCEAWVIALRVFWRVAGVERMWGREVCCC